MSDILSYEALVTEFEEGLLTRLRGHRSVAPFLEMWVPDEDPVRSLLSMFEAAELAGERELTVEISAASLAGRDIQDVATMAAEFGSCTFEAALDGWRVHLVMKAGDDAFLSVASPFRERLKERVGRPLHSKSVQIATPEENLIELSSPTGALTLVVGPGRCILRASHSGADSAVTEAILDYLCDLIAGLPVEEAAHHGCHRLLARLRDGVAQQAVPGIVLPQNAGSAFAAPLALCQAIRPSWIASGQVWPEENFFADAPSLNWLGLSVEARAAAVQNILTEDGASSLVSIDPNLLGHPTRVVITLSETLSSDEKPSRVRKIERRLAEQLEPRLEVYVEELKDQSGIRRL
jgi:hypothetical protein